MLEASTSDGLGRTQQDSTDSQCRSKPWNLALGSSWPKLRVSVTNGSSRSLFRSQYRIERESFESFEFDFFKTFFFLLLLLF